MALVSNLVGTASLNAAILSEIAQLIADHIIVCNYAELAFLINDFLEEKGLPKVNQQHFIKFLKGKEVPVELAESPEFHLLEKLIKRAVIQSKRDLMDKYLNQDDWKEMKRGEFLFATRYANFGQEEAENAVQLENAGASIIINIDNRKIEMAAPITSEVQMLSEAEDAVQKYLGQRGLLIDED